MADTADFYRNMGQGLPALGAYTQRMLAQADQRTQPSELALRGSTPLNILNSVLGETAKKRVESYAQKEMQAEQSRTMLVDRVNDLLARPDLTEEAKSAIKEMASRAEIAQMYDSLKRSPEKKGLPGYLSEMLESLTGGKIPKAREALPEDVWTKITDYAVRPQSSKSTWRQQANVKLAEAKAELLRQKTAATGVQATEAELTTSEWQRMAAPIVQELQQHLSQDDVDNWMRTIGYGAVVPGSLEWRLNVLGKESASTPPPPLQPAQPAFSANVPMTPAPPGPISSAQSNFPLMPGYIGLEAPPAQTPNAPQTPIAPVSSGTAIAPGQKVKLRNGQTVTVKSVNPDGSFEY